MTDPFSSSFQDGLSGKLTFNMTANLGAVFTPRFFCCDDPNSLGLTEGKQPVAVIELSPNPAFTSEDVTFDGSNSYDPDGSIASYAWTFESHTPSSGTAASGTLNYASAGTYTIQLVVTDGTGLKSAPAREELIVSAEDLEAYIATAGSGGVFYRSGTANWQDKNTGLQEDDLTVYDVIIDPATQMLAEAQKTVWRATAGGIQVSNDGGASWTEKNPNSVANSWSDGTAPTIADLTFKKLLFAGSYLLVAATWQSGSDYRSAFFSTQDFATMRSDTSATVTWSEISNGWSS